MKDYAAQAIKTENVDYLEIGANQTVRTIRLNHAALGLAGEVGEFVDTVKKTVFYGKELDEANLKEELGDMLWYIVLACDELGVTISELQEANITKLKIRYPKQFNNNDAINRDTKKELKGMF